MMEEAGSATSGTAAEVEVMARAEEGEEVAEEGEGMASPWRQSCTTS